MRRVLAVFAALAAANLAAPVSVASAESHRPQVGNYIVVLQDGVADPRAVAAEHANEHAAVVADVYEAALKGYSAALNPGRVKALTKDPRVKYVEEDGVASVQAQTVPWGIGKVGATVSSTVAGDGAGAVGGVDVYIIDTGVAPHPDLNLVNHVNFTSGPNADCNGHGTHVAGTAAAVDNAGDVVGVAPGARVHGVKVLSCSGNGPWSKVIRGIDWVTATHGPNAVANMSLAGPASQALDDAIANSVQSGVLFVLAAGNSRDDACNYSPARAGGMDGVVTVAATDIQDLEAGYTNVGPCVDVWAPGTGTLSTAMGGGTTIKTGTSMAAPHTAGAAALWLSRSPGASPAAVESVLESTAVTTGALSRDGRAVTRLDVSSF